MYRRWEGGRRQARNLRCPESRIKSHFQGVNTCVRCNLRGWVRRGLRISFWIEQITDSGEMVWYDAGNESLHGTDLSKNWKRESENSLKKYCHKEAQRNGRGVKVPGGRSGTKRGLLLFLIFFKEGWNYSMSLCWWQWSSRGKNVMQKKERIINPYCLNRIWELVWNFATMWNSFCGKIFDFDIGKLEISSNPTRL